MASIPTLARKGKNRRGSRDINEGPGVETEGLDSTMVFSYSQSEII